MSIKKLLMLAISVLVAAALATAQAATVKTSGIYSDLAYYDEGGDLMGIELFVFYADGYMVLFQEAVGEPMPPHLVKAKVEGDAIEFSVPGDADTTRTFRGKITATAIVGHWVGSATTFELPRRNSYWQ